MNIYTLSDTELIAYSESLIQMQETRQNILNDPIAIERLKNRKVIGKDENSCHKYQSLKEHINPEFKALMDKVDAEINKRGLKI